MRNRLSTISLPVEVDAGGVEGLQELLRVAVRKVQREPADLVRLGNPATKIIIQGGPSASGKKYVDIKF